MCVKSGLLVFAFVLAICPVLAQSPIDVEDVLLDKETLYTVCPTAPFPPHRYCNMDSVSVKLKTLATTSAVEGSEFYYTASGGEIVGTGSEVVWNLSDLAPGTYSVTVGIGFGGVIRGKVVTKTVKLAECPECHLPCQCPTVELVGPSSKVRAGDMFIVRLKMTGGDQRDRRTCRWTAVGGTIVRGELGTRVIVKAPKDSAGKNIELTVDLDGFYRQCGCVSQDKISVFVSN